MVPVGELCGVLVRHMLTYIQTGDLCEWTNDAQRLILSGFDKISDSPTNLYRHVLPFCPSTSWLHEYYTPETLGVVKVVRGHPNNWGTCTREIPFDRYPEALVYRKDMIAVGLSSGDITILDAITGSSRSTLSGHMERITSLAFSLDGTLLVSGSVDDAIKLWDIQTGGVVKTFRGRASSLSISSDATTIASGSTRDVRLWDVRTGECQQIINTTPTPGGVTCLEFLSAIPGCLTFIAGGLVQQLDINGSKTRPTISGLHIAFSSNGQRFVLCDSGPPTVRDTISGEINATLHSPGQDFNRCCFSPSDKFVAGVADVIVYVWNVADTPHLVETFIPDTSSISCLAYSSSLISLHGDGKVRFRRIDGDTLDETVANTKSTGSPRGKIIYTALQAEDCIAISVDSAGTIERWDLSSGLPELLLQTPEIRSVAGVRLIDGKLTIVYRGDFFRTDWNVATWDIKAGGSLRPTRLSDNLSTLDNTPDLDLGISKDGTTFFVVNPHEIRTLSTSTGQNTGSSFHRKYTSALTPLSVTLDGPRIWICPLGKSQAWSWDLRNLSSPPSESHDMPNKYCLVGFCPEDGGWSKTGHSSIVDIASQKEVFCLPGEFAHPCEAAWDGRYLFAGYDTGEVLILDFVHMTL